MSFPLIDVAPLLQGSADVQAIARELDLACREHGFFRVRGHGAPPELIAKLERLSRDFFARPVEEKMRVSMERGGRAWRGYFPVGAELTYGKADLKEGLYFGEELGPEHPEVRADTPLHGTNLFPAEPAGMREAVLEYMRLMTTLGHALLRGLATGLGWESTRFEDRWTRDPFTLFRIFHYPAPTRPEDQEAWGVGAHTDYGVLTLLMQDDRGGLEVHSPSGWIAVPPEPDVLVCNIGDMLEKMTGGAYRSTPHRVRNASGRDRLSFPFFFDPGFRAKVDGVEGEYGDYILSKVTKVFPGLARKAL